MGEDNLILSSEKLSKYLKMTLRLVATVRIGKFSGTLVFLPLSVRCKGINKKRATNLGYLCETGLSCTNFGGGDTLNHTDTHSARFCHKIKFCLKYGNWLEVWGPCSIKGRVSAFLRFSNWPNPWRGFFLKVPQLFNKFPFLTEPEYLSQCSQQSNTI